MLFTSDREAFCCVLCGSCPLTSTAHLLTTPSYLPTTTHPFSPYSLNVYCYCTCIPAAFDFRAPCTKVACHIISYSFLSDLANVHMLLTQNSHIHCSRISSEHFRQASMINPRVGHLSSSRTERCRMTVESDRTWNINEEFGAIALSRES